MYVYMEIFACIYKYLDKNIKINKCFIFYKHLKKYLNINIYTCKYFHVNIDIFNKNIKDNNIYCI